MRAFIDGPATKRVTVAVLLLAACGTTLPARYVIEHDLGAYAFRRYQKSLDIEIPVADNVATGHTAAYLQRTPHANVAIVTAYVTVYAHAKSLTAEARVGLGKLAGYNVANGELFGQHVWLLSGAGNEHWCVWVSENRLVKLGAPTGSDFPEEIVDAYADLYPSDLDEHGIAKVNSASAGPAKEAASEDNEPGIPANLREGAPR